MGIIQGSCEIVALGSEECVGHAAPDRQGVDSGQQILDGVHLAADLGTTENGGER